MEYIRVTKENHTNQCPFPAKYVPIIEMIAKEQGIAFRSVHIMDKETA